MRSSQTASSMVEAFLFAKKSWETFSNARKDRIFRWLFDSKFSFCLSDRLLLLLDANYAFFSLFFGCFFGEIWVGFGVGSCWMCLGCIFFVFCFFGRKLVVFLDLLLLIMRGIFCDFWLFFCWFLSWKLLHLLEGNILMFLFVRF